MGWWPSTCSRPSSRVMAVADWRQLIELTQGRCPYPELRRLGQLWLHTGLWEPCTLSPACQSEEDSVPFAGDDVFTAVYLFAEINHTALTYTSLTLTLRLGIHRLEPLVVSSGGGGPQCEVQTH